MSHASRAKLLVAGAVLAVAALGGWRVHAQAAAEPTNDLPNPYQTIENYFKLPAGRSFGSTSAVDIDRDGKSIWVAERCGANSACLSNPVDPVLLFDAAGNLVRSFGKGLIVSPHGIHVDREGNVWVTDYQDDATGGRQALPGAGGAGGGAGRGGGRAGGAADAGGRGGAPDAAGGRGGAADAAGGGGGRGRGRGADGAGAAAAGGGGRAGGAAAGGRGGPNPNATMGHQVFKFSPTGEVLLRIGKPGGAAPPDCCLAPNDVATDSDGNIWIGQGHGGPHNAIFKFDRTGKMLQSWIKSGSGPGEFNQPHSLAFDSQGRLFVADRGNNRTLVFDRNMNQVADWPQFSRPSGIYIDRNDNLYSADSESGSVNQAHKAWVRGIRIGSAKDGKVVALIPDPQKDLTSGTLAAEGVAVDAAGNIYGAEVGPRKVQKYVRK
jgi:streptogramin lyase